MLLRSSSSCSHIDIRFSPGGSLSSSGGGGGPVVAPGSADSSASALSFWGSRGVEDAASVGDAASVAAASVAAASVAAASVAAASVAAASSGAPCPSGGNGSGGGAAARMSIPRRARREGALQEARRGAIHRRPPPCPGGRHTNRALHVGTRHRGRLRCAVVPGEPLSPLTPTPSHL